MFQTETILSAYNINVSSASNVFGMYSSKFNLETLEGSENQNQKLVPHLIWGF